jgi:hypothetical protein
MGMNRPGLGRYIAPANHPAVGQGDQLRKSLFDIVENECLRRFERRRFQEGQITPLLRDNIEGSMKTLDMILRYWNNFDGVHRLGNVLIRAPRGMALKQLSWIHPSDNGLI